MMKYSNLIVMLTIALAASIVTVKTSHAQGPGVEGVDWERITSSPVHYKMTFLKLEFENTDNEMITICDQANTVDLVLLGSGQAGDAMAGGAAPYGDYIGWSSTISTSFGIQGRVEGPAVSDGVGGTVVSTYYTSTTAPNGMGTFVGNAAAFDAATIADYGIANITPQGMGATHTVDTAEVFSVDASDAAGLDQELAADTDDTLELIWPMVAGVRVTAPGTVPIGLWPGAPTIGPVP